MVPWFFCWIKDVNHRFELYVWTSLISIMWMLCTDLLYQYICIHLSNVCCLVIACWDKNHLHFFISKLTEFSFKIWNNRDLEWWYRSDEAGCYIIGIRAGRTFRPVSCESAMFFCAFSGCFVECLVLVVCWCLMFVVFY